MKRIDFSCKHDVLIRNEDGTVQPMDQPYFKAIGIAPGTWMILTDGDHSYLVEGENEALVIDSGYGCGNIRALCQCLTEKPVRRIANTHYHFDHTANNGYFDCAYMSAEAREKATIPFPSFAGINFPRDYPVEIIDEGYVFHLGGRDLEVFAVHNHTEGGLMFLDRKERLLFSGDEIQPNFFAIRTDLDNVQELLNKVKNLETEYDRLCAGPCVMEKGVAGKVLAGIRYLMDGHWDQGVEMPPRRVPEVPEGPVIFERRNARPCDMPKPDPEEERYQRMLQWEGVSIIYDIRLKNAVAKEERKS